LELRQLKYAFSAMAQGVLPLLIRLDPELAHELGLRGLGKFAGCWPPLDTPASLAVKSMGLSFRHPLGLAAGFDKNGDCIEGLGALGFSHLELGTVTPRPQPGNPKPRMFRFPADSALINRMGFNNKGVDHLVSRLRQRRVPRYEGILGISIGKNFDTPLERALDDYLICLRKVFEYADYIAVNVSSPNTARLRELQSREGLKAVLGGLLEERSRLEQRIARRVPLLVKIAPDLDDEDLDVLAREVQSLGIDGIIATNTTINHALLQAPPDPPLPGGLSGAPLHPRSVAVIRQLRRVLPAGFPIIGVGGIVSPERAKATLAAGATLIQIYTGFAYRGATLVREIVKGLP
jgi:dihydroorotate dehydrogenase